MTTIVTQVLDRLDAILIANALPGTNVFRDRADAESRSETPSINVVAKDDQVEPFSGEMDKHELTVDLRFAVRDPVPTPAVEAQHAAVHRAVVDDAAFREMDVVSVRHLNATYDPAEADLTSLVKSVVYRFTYLIPKNTL